MLSFTCIERKSKQNKVAKEFIKPLHTESNSSESTQNYQCPSVFFFSQNIILFVISKLVIHISSLKSMLILTLKFSSEPLTPTLQVLCCLVDILSTRWCSQFCFSQMALKVS